MKIFTLKSLLMSVLLCAGLSAWADDIEVTKTMTEIVEDNEYTVSSGSDVICYTNFSLDENITVSTSGTGNCGSFWGTTTQEWRLYQNKSGDVTISAAEGYLLKSVTFTYSVSNTGVLKNGSTNVASGSAISDIDASSITCTVGNTKTTTTNGQVRITAISVTYYATGSSVAKPTCSPAAGEVEAGTEVSLIKPDGADRIIYTTDGTNPTLENGYEYNEEIIIGTTTTIKAIAIYGEETSTVSGVATFAFTVTPPDAPTFKIGNTTVTGNMTVDAGTNVSLAQENAAMILYTTDGSAPSYENTVGTEYTQAITVANTTTIKAIAVDDFGNESAVASYTFTVNPPAAPTINFDASTSTVTITAAAGLTIKYTTGEGDPTTTYTAPIPVTETTTFKAIAVDAYGNQSTVTTKKVTIVNIEDGVFDFTLGTDYGSGISTTTSSTYYEAKSSTWTAGNVTMVISGKYRWWNNDKTMRLYAVGNNDPEGTNPGALTISAPANNVITKVEFDKTFSLSADKGKLSGTTWTGMANSVAFTATATSNIKTITVTYRPVVANGNFGTICLPYGVDADDISGATFYTIASKTMDGENVTGINLEPVTTGLTAGVGYIYKATGTISLTPNNTTATDPVTGGAIVGTFTDETEVPNGKYIVSGNKLCPTANDYGYINAYRAYVDLTNVPVSGSAAKVRISVQGDDATAITAIEAAEAVNNGVIYNLSGQRVVKPLKGIYIQNGKKFIVK